MRIVALIVQGCKNREIAFRLKTTEQVVKNYLRSIYDKTGVSDRLELALFTLHHRVLAEAAADVGTIIEKEEREATVHHGSDAMRAMHSQGNEGAVARTGTWPDYIV
uniref:HTH luxR-type domain-containing protein n=1 Tax=mine drainage metagenome TaxID=410659 RepID=E6QLN7_9ZZZZ